MWFFDWIILIQMQPYLLKIMHLNAQIALEIHQKALTAGASRHLTGSQCSQAPSCILRL
jgi:hypothetical protein